MKVPSALRPDPLQLQHLDQSRRLLTVGVLILSGAALIAASVPSSWWEWTGIVEVDDRPFGPFLPGLLALCMVAWAARLARRGSVGTRLERPIAALIGVAIAALCGNGLRQFLQLLVLRQGWGISSVLHEADRALALVWIYLAGVVLALGLVAALVAAVDAVLRGPLRRNERLAPVLLFLARGSDAASWVPTALVGLFVVGHVVLGRAVLEALGEIFPAAGGFPDASGPQFVFLGMWPQLSELAVMQFGLGLWAAIELARLTHTAAGPRAPRPNRTWTPRLVAIAAIAACATALWRSHDDLGSLGLTSGAVIAVSLSVGLLAVHVSSWVGTATGRRATFHRIEGWFPAAAGDLAVVVPILVVLGATLAWQWAPVAIGPVSSVLRFPAEAGDFWNYWQVAKLAPSYGDVTAVDVVRPGLVVIAIMSGLVVINRRERLQTSWWALPLFLGLAVLSSRLGDPDTFLLLFAALVATAFILAKVSDHEPEWWVPVVGVGIICAFAIGYLLTPDLPLTLLLAGSITLRFGWQAGDLNKQSGQPARVELSLALALLLSGLLLAERAASDSGYFAGQRFAALGQSVGLAFVAIPMAFALGMTEMWRRLDGSPTVVESSGSVVGEDQSAGATPLATGDDDPRGPA